MRNATEIEMCGRTIRIGDEMRVQYTDGKRLKGCWISGTVTELWMAADGERGAQARLSCGWCFHPCDAIEYHKGDAYEQEYGRKEGA